MRLIKEYFFRITGILLAVFAAGLTYMQKDSFLADQQYGIWFLIIEIVMIASLAAVSWKKKKGSELRFRSYSIGLLVLAPLISEITVELLNGNMLWDIDMFGNVCMNYLINLLLYLAVLAFTGSFRVSIRSVSLLLAIFGTVNWYVKLYKGGPFLPWDITAIQTAGNVAGKYSYNLSWQIVVAITFTLLLWKLAGWCLHRRSTPKFRIMRISAAAVFAFAIWIFYFSDFFAANFAATPDFFNQTRGYEAKGAVAEFLVNTKYLSLSKPDGYDPSTLEEEVTELTENEVPSILETTLIHQGQSEDDAKENSRVDENVKDPNIIVIMNEAFSDLSAIGDFETNEDYMPFIHSLEDDDNAIVGNSYVSTIGTGTSNTEYEFLTGNSMAFLPLGSNAYQLYIKNDIPSLVSSLKNQNYSADALHPYYRDDWNRPAVYDFMGFDSFTGMEDMPYIDKLRAYCSDAFDFEWLEQMYKKRDPSKPFYMFNITMQNHSAYDMTDKDWYPRIKLANMAGSYPDTEQYLSLIRETDDAFADLVSYFNNVDEPTIILMFGDHQPFIEDAFYEEVMGKKITELSDDENQKRYITKFVMWANYDIPSANIDQISVNYLSTLLAEMSNTETTPYQDFLASLYQQMPVITMYGCRDWDNTWFSADDRNTMYADQLAVYRRAAYNSVIDDSNRISKLFYIKKDDASE